MSINTRRIQREWKRVVDKINPVDRTTVSDALRIAADQYERDAQANAKTPRVAARFQEQCDDCRDIADEIEC